MHWLDAAMLRSDELQKFQDGLLDIFLADPYNPSLLPSCS